MAVVIRGLKVRLFIQVSGKKTNEECCVCCKRNEGTSTAEINSAMLCESGRSDSSLKRQCHFLRSSLLVSTLVARSEHQGSTNTALMDLLVVL